MGTVINLQQARHRRQERLAETNGFAALDRALAALEQAIRDPHVAANTALVERELQAIHRLINAGDVEQATDRIQWLRSRLDHASTRRSS